MYKIQNKTSGAQDTVSDADWEKIRKKRISDDPADKRTWASKYKILDHKPDDLTVPATSFQPPEIAIPEVQAPPAKTKASAKKKDEDTSEQPGQ